MNKTKVLFLPVLSLVILGVITIVAGQILLSRIFSIRSEMASLSVNQAQLDSKLARLEDISEDSLTLSEAAYLALPDANPAAFVISHIRRITGENNMVLSQIDVSEARIEGEETTRVNVDLKTQGSFQATSTFLNNLSRVSPLVNVESVKVNASSQNIYELTATLHTFWAPLPKELPQVTDGSVLSLSEGEINILTQLSELTKPAFAELPPATTSAERANPFDF